MKVSATVTVSISMALGGEIADSISMSSLKAKLAEEAIQKINNLMVGELTIVGRPSVALHLRED